MTSPGARHNAFGTDTELPYQADRSALLEIKQRFLNLNHERICRVQDALPRHQCQFIDLLALLFHVNHPALPGYVEKDVPQGVSDYSPNDRSLHTAMKHARSFSFNRRPLRSFDIHAVYLMGSTGTIAQSTTSDFDVWLCYRPDLEAEQLKKLQAKSDAIANWADGLGLDVHFFLMSAERFRDAGANALSTESSGTTQHHLLLDEFYRTALLLAGRAPLWWQVPEEFEHDYDTYASTLVHRRFIKPDEYLDFGSVARVQAEEFFGATLWQLSKAVSAPHKSLLKILLLEAYASDYPEVDLLSLRYKRAVYADVKNPETLDPYMLLHEKVTEHLESHADAERMELARRCLYFKVNQALSRRASSGTGDWRREIMQELARRWGWSLAALRDLDARRRWKIDRTLEERRALVSALNASYKSLSRFAHRHTDFALVSERDMTILGRKLFTVFGHKAGKIELVNHSMSEDLSEAYLTLQQVDPPEEPAYWLLFRGKPELAQSREINALKRGWTPLEVVGWAYFNGLISPVTRLLVHAADSGVDTRDVEAINEHLHRCFPQRLAESAKLDAYATSPVLSSAVLFVNLGVDPLAQHARQGRRLTTSRNDALSYSGWHENLVREIDYLIVTSWHEILTFKFHDVEGLMSCLCEHLRWIVRGRRGGIEPVEVHCCTPRHGDTISQRVNTLVRNVVSWFLAPSIAARRRFILRAGERYYGLLCEEDAVTHEFGGSFDGLLRHLGRPQPEFTTVTFESQALDDPVLRQIYDLNRAGTAQLFFEVAGANARIHVLDENGALFRHLTPFYSRVALLNQFSRFFESVRFRQNAASSIDLRGFDSDSLPATTPSKVDNPPTVSRPTYFHVSRRRDGGWQIDPVAPPDLSDVRDYYDLRVVGERVGERSVFTLYCDQWEISTRSFGARVFEEVATHILDHRHGVQLYPIYITDIDLSQLSSAKKPGAPLPTIQYLAYKLRIEKKLNEALTRIVGEHQGLEQDSRKTTRVLHGDDE